MKLEKTITSIGNQAISSNEDDLIILFGEGATPALREVSVIQDGEATAELDLVVGDQISFGDQHYQINYIGPLANENLNSIGHVTLIFREVPAENRLGNGIYLTPATPPKIKIGMTIEYEMFGKSR